MHLNESAVAKDKFVIDELDDTHLFVQPRIVEWLENELKKFFDSNVYAPPPKAQQ